MHFIAPQSQANVLCIFGLLFCQGQARAQQRESTHPHNQQRFQNPRALSRTWDSPSRNAWQQPDKVLDALKVSGVHRVADIGAGTGYFSLRLARRIPEGVVYAVDVEKNMLAFIKKRADEEKLVNLKTVLATPDNAALPERVDTILIVNTFHHIDARVDYLRRLASYLKPGGKIAVIDYRLQSSKGPPKTAKVADDAVKNEFKKAGYKLDAEHTFLLEQFYLVFTVAP